MKAKNSLAALAAVAAAMPGHADPVPTEKAISYRFSEYQEGEIPENRTFSPVLERYNIEVHQLGYRRPLSGNWYLRSEMQYETMSGASPMQTYQNTDGQSVVLMSGASIEESRFDLKLSPTRYFDGTGKGAIDGTLGGTLALSTENDYNSVSLGVDATLNLFDKHTTLLGSISTSYDMLAPTDATLSESRQAADGQVKRSISIYEGVSQVINKATVLQIGGGFTRLTGYLSDPYKLEDRRPDDRTQFLLDSRLRRYYKVLSGAAIHLDYRYISDSWGIHSNTIDLAWAQKMSAGRMDIFLTPSVRYYRQTEASFYSVDASGDEMFTSSDYRLSSYGAVSAGVEARFVYGGFQLSVDWQQYVADEEMMLLQIPDEEAPALVNYSILSIGVEYRRE